MHAFWGHFCLQVTRPFNILVLFIFSLKYCMSMSLCLDEIQIAILVPRYSNLFLTKFYQSNQITVPVNVIFCPLVRLFHRYGNLIVKGTEPSVLGFLLN